MFNNVLLAVDLSHEESWRKALPVALAICRANDATLHAVSVVPDLHIPMIAGYFPADFMRKLVTSTETRLAAFLEQHVPSDISCEDAVVSGGTIYEMLIDYADKHDVDLIVMEAYHPDLKDFLLGSNAEKVARHAKQSVLLVRE